MKKISKITIIKFVIYSIFISVITLLFLHQMDSDGDFFQHANIGRIIIQNYMLPKFDTFTFTSFGHEYIIYSVLSGSLFFLIYSTLGAYGINLLVLSVAFFTFFLAIFYLNFLKLNYKAIFTSIFIVMPVVATRWPSRPEIFIYPIIISFLIIDQLKASKPWISILYPLLMLLFVLLYTSAFPLVAGLLFFILLKNLWEDNFHISQDKYLFYFSIVVSYPIALLNGYGVKPLMFILLIPKMTNLWGDWTGMIQLINTPNFSNFPAEVIYLYLAFFIFVLLLIIVQIKNINKNLFVFLLALTIFLPFFAIRQRALSAILALPLIAVFINSLSLKFKQIYIFTTCLSMIFILSVLAYYPPSIGEGNYPFEAIKIIKQYDLSGRIFNLPSTGSFISYELPTQVKIYSDTRDDLYINENVLEQIHPFLDYGASMSYFLIKYKIDMILASKFDSSSFQNLFHDTTWAPIYYDGQYFLLVKRSIAIKKQIPIISGLDPYKQIR